jgi:acyl carrier protein
LSIRIASTNQDLFESGLLDSLSLVRLIFELETRFQVELPLENMDLASLKSIDEMAILIAGRVAGSQEPSSEMVNQLAN